MFINFCIISYVTRHTKTSLRKSSLFRAIKVSRWVSYVYVSRTCPSIRRVLRPGIEKSTPFSGGRYQDDQPYHHLRFPLPCVSSPRRRRTDASSSFLRRTPMRWTSSPVCEKFRSSAAFCWAGATFVVKNHPFSPSLLALPSSFNSYTYKNHPFFPSDSPSLLYPPSHFIIRMDGLM